MARQIRNTTYKTTYDQQVQVLTLTKYWSHENQTYTVYDVKEYRNCHVEIVDCSTEQSVDGNTWVQQTYQMLFINSEPIECLEIVQHTGDTTDLNIDVLYAVEGYLS